MKITLDIQDNRVDAFLNFIKILDYVSIDDDTDIPDWQKQELDKRLGSLEKGEVNIRDWDEAKNEVFNH